MGREERLNRMAREAAPLIDRFRRALWPGVKVEFHPRLPIVYDITDIRPVVDPRQPAGLWQLTLSTSVIFNAFGGAPIEELTAVVFPKPIDADRQPEQPLQPPQPPQTPKQDNDSPAGADQYHPPDIGQRDEPNEG
jgi:hypothetical protein